MAQTSRPQSVGTPQSVGWLQRINQFFGVQLFAVAPSLPNTSDPVQPMESLFAPLNVTQPAVYPDPNMTNYIKKGYCGNGSVYTIVSRVASKFGSIPRYAYKIQDNKAAREVKTLVKQKGFKLYTLKDLHKKAYDEQIVNNLFSKILQTPNPMQGQDEFYEMACVFRMVTGNTFVWLNRGKITGADGKPLADYLIDKIAPIEMWVLPTQYVEIIPDPLNVWGVKWYQFNVNGVRWRIRKEDMIHWKAPNPNFDGVTRMHMFGLSPLQPGNKWLTEDETGTDSTVSAYQNDGAKGVLYQKTMLNNTANQKSDIDRVVNQKINQRDMRGAVAAFTGEWGYQNLAQTGQEMERMDGRDKAFVRLCNLFGCPAMIFDTNTTFSNVEQAEKALVTNLVAPYACSFRDAVNAKLLPAFQMDRNMYTHDIDISQLPELQTEMSQLATTLATSWWVTPNQKLKMQNQEESTDANMDKVWMPNNLIMMDDAALNNQIDSYDPNASDTPNPGATGKNNSQNAGDNLPDPSKGDTGAGN